MQRIRLDAVATVTREVASTQELTNHEVTLYSIPAFDESGGPTRASGDGIGSAKTRVTGGEVLVSKLNPRKPRVQMVAPVGGDEIAVCSGEFVALRPHGIDGRYLGYALRSDRFRQRLEARVQSVTRSQQRVSPDDIAHAWVEIPDTTPQQETIAGFLDAETVRIDALASNARRLLQLARERLGCETSRVLADETLEPRLLRHVVERVEVGVVVRPAAMYAQSGIPFLRGVNVQPGRILLDDLKYLDPDKATVAAKSRLRTGDVVVVRTGQAGAAAVVPPELEGANCVDLLIVRPNADLAPAYLELLLNSEVVRSQVATSTVGSIQSHLNVGALREILLPVPPVVRQHEVIAEAYGIANRHQRLIAVVDRQIALLHERRQALITAAVTGKLQVTDDMVAKAVA